MYYIRTNPLPLNFTKVENKLKITLFTSSIVLFNLLVAGCGILIFASYYTPGNPPLPNRIDIDIVGYLATFIGLSQILYLAPLLIYAVRLQKWNLVKGTFLAGIITIVLNVVFWIILLNNK